MSEKVAVVTGAGSGIGWACVEALTGQGWRVAALDIDPAGTMRCEASFGATPVVTDVSQEASVAAAVEQVVADLGRIDVVANVAGITGSRQAAECHVTPIEEWNQVIGVNLTGTFLVCRAVLPHMLDAGGGIIINVASVAGLTGFPGRCAYLASKGGVVQITRSLAIDYAGRGIRANAVCPGWVDTPMTRWRLEDPELGPSVRTAIPQGRVARPEEIAEVVALLASGKMAYANGSMFVLDGGWTC